MGIEWEVLVQPMLSHLMGFEYVCRQWIIRFGVFIFMLGWLYAWRLRLCVLVSIMLMREKSVNRCLTDGWTSEIWVKRRVDLWVILHVISNLINFQIVVDIYRKTVVYWNLCYLPRCLGLFLDHVSIRHVRENRRNCKSENENWKYY